MFSFPPVIPGSLALGSPSAYLEQQDFVSWVYLRSYSRGSRGLL